MMLVRLILLATKIMTTTTTTAITITITITITTTTTTTTTTPNQIVNRPIINAIHHNIHACECRIKLMIIEDTEIKIFQLYAWPVLEL
jgi:hypothetical protein